jgi:cell division septation protein DedD
VTTAVTDITHHELVDEGFHEIQLSGKQLVFLFMATTIVAVVIFLCGVQVGRGVRTERVAETSEASALAPTLPATAPPPVTAAASGPPAAEPPAPAQETDDELSYAKRLQSDTSPKEQLKPRNDPAPATASAAGAPAKSTPVAAATPPPSAASARPMSTVPSGPAASRSGAWVIQVNALTDRAAAAAIVRRLTGKGYPAFVLDPSAGAPALYRVQVGRYRDRREADQVARRLEKEEQFKPWVQH